METFLQSSQAKWALGLDTANAKTKRNVQAYTKNV